MESDVVNLARVIIVENDIFTRTTLATALSANNIEVLAVAENASGAIRAALDHNPDVAILDLDLGPGPSGIDIAYALRADRPTLGIVFVTSYKDPRLAAMYLPPLPQGASYIDKNSLEDFNVLVTEILAVTRKPLANRKYDLRNSNIALTDTQVDVLRLVASGLSTSEIALRRGVSEKAVEQTLMRIRDALELPKDKSTNQRAALVRAYFKNAGKIA